MSRDKSDKNCCAHQGDRKDVCHCGYHHDHKHVEYHGEHEHHAHCGSDCCGCGHDHGKEGHTKDWLIPLIGLVCLIAIVIIPFSEKFAVLEIILYGIVYLFVGHEVLIESAKHIAKGQIFDENFLMAVASIGAFAIGEYPEAIAVMILYNIGEFCQNAAIRRSKKSVSNLMDVRPDYANRIKDGKEERIHPQQAAVGDVIILRPGEKIPLDCSVIEGTTTVNTSALTGESLPVECHEGDALISGCINITGVVKAKVEKSFAQSTVNKVLALMEESTEKKANPERFISRFAKIYTPIICGIALLTAILPSLITGDWVRWIHTALTFLVISCPCALVISVPLSYVGGIGNASRHGILVKGSTALEQLPKLSNLVCDKTGTITEGVFSVAEVKAADGVEDKALLSVAAAAEMHTTHPIGRSIVKYARQNGIAVAAGSDYQEIAGKGIQMVIEDKTVLAGNAALLLENRVQFTPEQNGTVVYLAEDGKYLGCIHLIDAIRKEAKNAFAQLHHQNIRCTMLTGDKTEAAQQVATELSLADYKAELLPQDKVSALEGIMQQASGSVAFIGDGVNDAPVLARADVGIAMGSIGSDAALEAADIVIMKDDLTRIPLGIKLAKQTKTIVYQNIVFALGVKGLIMLLGFFGYANMWLAVFADVGVALLAIVNAVRPIISKRRD